MIFWQDFSHIVKTSIVFNGIFSLFLHVIENALKSGKKSLKNSMTLNSEHEAGRQTPLMKETFSCNAISTLKIEMNFSIFPLVLRRLLTFFSDQTKNFG